MAPDNPKKRRTTSGFTPTPVDSKYLWQLIPAENETALIGKLCTFLQGGLWLARLDTFTSSVPEGTLPERNAGLLSKLLGPQQSGRAQELYRIGAMQRSFASCWHMSDDMPSCYAWSQFGGRGNGIAIRTTPGLMDAALKPFLNGKKGPGCCGKVKYINHITDLITDGNVIEPAFCVQSDYRDENEARVLLYSDGFTGPLALENGPFGKLVEPADKGFTGGHAKGKAIVIPFGLGYIECIAIGDGVAGPTDGRLRKLCRTYNFPVKRICRVAINGLC